MTALADTPAVAGLTDALWAWLAADDRLDAFAAAYDLDTENDLVDAQCLADWVEDTIREGADDLAGAVLFAACRLADWQALADRAEAAYAAGLDD